MASLRSRSAGGKSRRTTYDVITDRILALLEAGTVPWRQPWANVGHPRNLLSGHQYRGINVFMLSAASYSNPYWLTFKQAKDKGGSVRKGEHGYPVVYWQWIDDEADDEPITTKNGRLKARCFCRYYTVFNVSQCDGIEAPPIDGSERPTNPIPACESIVAAMPNRPPINHGGDRACYQPRTDTVSMPERWQFASMERYYSVLFHELTHATGHPNRCNRKANWEDWAPFGSADYSREELVAEMGAAFLDAEAGIEPDTLDDSAAYIANWLRKLRNDNRCVVHAAAQAQRAADYIRDRKADTARKAVA